MRCPWRISSGRKSELEAETYEIDEQLRALTSKQATADSYVRFAELQLVDMANVWRIAEPEQKHRVQKLLFGNGLVTRQNKEF